MMQRRQTREDKILLEAERIKRRRFEAVRRYRDRLVRSTRKRLGQKTYDGCTPKDGRCAVYWSCCYAQGRCEKKDDHRGAHKQVRCINGTFIYVCYGELGKWDHAVAVKDGGAK